MCNARLRRNSQWVHVSNNRIVFFWSTPTECECSSEPVPMFLTTRVIVLHHFPYLGPADKGLLYTFPTSKWLFSCARAPARGPHGPNRASFCMNPMYSIARTRHCPRKSCSPRQPMAAYMWNGLQPVTSFTLIPNPNRIKGESTEFSVCSHPLSIILMYWDPNHNPKRIQGYAWCSVKAVLGVVWSVFGAVWLIPERVLGRSGTTTLL